MHRPAPGTHGGQDCSRARLPQVSVGLQFANMEICWRNACTLPVCGVCNIIFPSARHMLYRSQLCGGSIGIQGQKVINQPINQPTYTAELSDFTPKWYHVRAWAYRAWTIQGACNGSSSGFLSNCRFAFKLSPGQIPLDTECTLLLKPKHGVFATPVLRKEE